MDSFIQNIQNNNSVIPERRMPEKLSSIDEELEEILSRQKAKTNFTYPEENILIA